MNTITKALVSTSFIVFILSLTQNAFSYQDFDALKTHSSISLFLMGSISFLGGGLMEWIVWLANPLSLLSILFLFRKKRIAIKTSLGALALALSFCTWEEVLAAENGRMAKIESLKMGYWLWVLSVALLCSAVLIYFSSAATTRATSRPASPDLQSGETR